VVCAHKGLPLSSSDPAFASPDDIGVVAKAYPDIDFIVYHSGYETEHEEGPYNSETPQGIDRLIKSLEDNELSPNSNVYAELGSTWRFVMSRPTQAAHVLGKLLKYIGQDRVVWGTDSIWYGTPQDQIMALRAFEISEEFQELYGYPALTQEIKAKIFGLNAAGPYGVDPDEIRCAITEDHLSQMRAQLTTEAIPTFRHYGPRNRREFLAFLKSRNGFPG
jgi:predicted TIM-barrel fold metal-dependent hydrolase